MTASFEEWRAEYPDGTRILWYEQYIEKKWLPGVITGAGTSFGHTVLFFKLDGDPPKMKRVRELSFENNALLKKE